MALPYTAERDFTYGLLFGNHATAPDFDPTTPSTAWTTLNTVGLPLEATVLFNKNVALRRPFRANGFRNRRLVDVDNDIKGVAPSLTVTMPATTATLDFLLASAFQEVTEAAATPFVKDFVYPAVANFPDFSVDAGAFFTLIKDSQVASSADEAMMSAVVQRITLSCYPDQNDGRLYLTADCIAKYHYENDTYAGTITYPTAISYYNFADIVTASIGGTAVTLYGFSFTFETSIKPIPVGGFVTGGRGTQQYVMTFLNTTGSIDVLWDAKARTLITGEDASNSGVIVLAWGSGADPITTTGDLLIKSLAMFNSHSFQGQDETKVRLEFDTMESSSEAFEVHMANALDRGATWTAGFWV